MVAARIRFDKKKGQYEIESFGNPYIKATNIRPSKQSLSAPLAMARRQLLCASITANGRNSVCRTRLRLRKTIGCADSTLPGAGLGDRNLRVFGLKTINAK